MHYLYLVRHSIVDPDSPRNELSQEGQEWAIKFGKWFLTSGYPLPSALCSSDRPRATQTAALVAQGLGSGIREVHDTRLDQKHSLLLPEDCLNPSGLPLTVIKELEENNPPEEIVATEEYEQLRQEHRRAGILLDWAEKSERVNAFVKTILEILDREESALVASHGNILQQSLQQIFPDCLDLSAFDAPTPHIGLTVLVKDGERVRLNRLFSTEWK